MVSYGSPKVTFEEIDRTAVVTDSFGRAGGVAILATWGPVDKVLTVTNKTDVETIFGKSNSTNAEYYLNLQSLFYYTNNVKVARINTGHLNATSSGTGLLIKNKDHYDQSFADGQGTVGAFTARYPGTKGNSIKVSICPANSGAFSSWTYKSLFPSAPATSTYVSQRSGSLDQVHVVVIDVDGQFSPNRNTVLEKYENLSLANDAKFDDGSIAYYKSVLTNNSNYVYWTDHPTEFSNAGSASQGTTFSVGTVALDFTLTGGTSDDAPTPSEIQSSYDLFADKNGIPIYVLVAPPLPSGSDGTTIANYILGIANTRKDCFASICPPTASISNASASTIHSNIISFAGTLNSTKEGVATSCAVRMYDGDNNRNIWVTSAGHMAGLLLTTPYKFDSPAGKNRGVFRRVGEISYNPTDAQRDELHNAFVNAIVLENASGVYLRGDRTLYRPNTLFRKIDVRGLMIQLQTVITAYSEDLLFERNDEVTASDFELKVSAFLEEIKNARGVTDYSVVTPVSTDPSTFKGDIYVKPTTSINYVNLSFIATSNSTSFSENVVSN